MAFRNKLFQKNSFSVIELTAVVATVGIIATFAVTSYQQTVQQSIEKDAVANLLALRSVENIYRSSSGTYWPNDGSTFHTTFGSTGINENLKMKLTETNVRYRCRSTTSSFNCEAHHPDFTDSADHWSLRVLESADPYCISNCPTCTASGCPGL